MNSLDPRVARLPATGTAGLFSPPVPLDQFETYEVFVQPKEGRPFQHEGPVHAPDAELAFILAKETFTRRFTCVSLCVTATSSIAVSPTTDANQDFWDLLLNSGDPDGSIHRLINANISAFELYYLPRRGKQHVHFCTIEAISAKEAMLMSKEKIPAGKQAFNLWAVRREDILFTSPDERDLWVTLPEKKFRDAAEYKGGDKLKNFIEAAHRSS